MQASPRQLTQGFQFLRQRRFSTEPMDGQCNRSMSARMARRFAITPRCQRSTRPPRNGSLAIQWQPRGTPRLTTTSKPTDEQCFHHWVPSHPAPGINRGKVPVPRRPPGGYKNTTRAPGLHSLNDLRAPDDFAAKPKETSKSAASNKLLLQHFQCDFIDYRIKKIQEQRVKPVTGARGGNIRGKVNQYSSVFQCSNTGPLKCTI